jgi:predicted DsbA family dithiol-disulfide isomerase
MALVRITEFTDPGCPWAWSAEPFRRRLLWRYGDQIEWRLRMVVLAESPQEYLDKGLTPEKVTRAYQTIQREHGMPMDTSLRPRMSATAPACRAVVAVRLHSPDAERALLRALRVRHFAGQLLDDRATREDAVRDVRLDAVAVEGWMQRAETEAALDEDRAAARNPTPAALAQEHRLTSHDGGHRYTCPSYEIVRLADGLQIDVPGFQPYDSYEVALANLMPDAELRDPPESMLQLLDWAAEPLATREVAVVCGIEHDEARQQLGRVAVERHLGYDGLWTAPGMLAVKRRL